MRAKTSVLILTLGLLVSFGAASPVPYEDMTISTETNSYLECEDGSETTDTSESLFKYTEVSSDRIVVERENGSTYTIDPQTRIINPNIEGSSGTRTSHWIFPNVEPGDTVQVSGDEYIVRSISDTVSVGDWNNVEAIRMSRDGEVTPPELDTRPETVGFEETAWYDSYSGLFLKRERQLSFELWNNNQGWVSCDATGERRLIPTGKDINNDDISDFTQILRYQEDPRKTDVNLNLEARKTQVDSFEPFQLTLDSVRDPDVEANLSFEGQRVATGRSFSVSLREAGDYSFSVEKSSIQVGELIHSYSGDSVSVQVEGQDQSFLDKISSAIPGIFGVFQSGEFVYDRLIISPAETEPGENVSVAVIVENIGDGSGTREISLQSDGNVVDTKEVTLEGGEGAEIEFSLQRSDTGEYDVSVGDLSGGFSVVNPPSFEFRDLNIESSEVAVGDQFTISADVSNTGNLPGKITADLKIDGAVHDSKVVSLADQDTKTVSFDTSISDVGSYTAGIANLTETVDIVREAEFEVLNLSIDSPEIALGESANVDVTVENLGGISGSHDVELYTHGEKVDSQMVSLGPGETQQVSFTFEEPLIGEFNLTSGGSKAVLSVNPYIWKATTATSYDSTTQQIGEEKTVFPQGDTVWAVFRYSLAEDSTQISTGLETNYALYGPDDDLVWSTSESFNVQDTQEHISWAELPMTQNSDSFSGTGEYRLEFEVSSPARGVSSSDTLTFTVQ